MGNKLSSRPRRNDPMATKLEQARKTGVLNLVASSLSPSSSTWSKIDVMSIKLIDISNNPLPHLPVEIYAMQNLKYVICFTYTNFVNSFRKLKCNHCQLENLYSAISNNGNLSHIEAEHNKLGQGLIGELPPSITHLSLAHNQFTCIHPSLHSSLNLLVLDLSGNQIQSLQGIAMVISLTDLCLDDNLISEIPEEVSSLSKLKRISLKRNRIGSKAVTFDGQSIHEKVFTDSNIESIDLEGNPIKKSTITNFNGVEAFLERRKKLKEKNLMMGASTDLELFGL